MNLERYEKIGGWQALERFRNGEVVFSFYNNEFSEFVMAGGELYSSPLSNHAQQRTLRTMTIDVIFKRAWYIPKPFDVRQAMLDRPNEWVGKFSVQDEEKTIWYYVGFDSKNFCALRMKKRNKYGMKEPVKWNGGNVVFAIDDDLDACIPIEDVPEEATR